MATLPSSPAFMPPTPSLDPDASIVRVSLGSVEIGNRMSTLVWTHSSNSPVCFCAG